jgi:hypothetical protein
MRRIIQVVLLIVVAATSVAAQQTYYSIYAYDGFIPKLVISERPAELQASLFPEHYQSASASADMKWVSENNSAIMEFLTTRADTILHVLRELSGIEWEETNLELFLVRYYPTLGSSDPLILPVGGMRSLGLIEATPSGNSLLLNLFYQLSRRMLAQATKPQSPFYLAVGSHPLMKPGPYRFDNLAMLLAVSAAQSMLGIDSTSEAYNSAFWKSHFRGRGILNSYLISKWVPTPTHTLAYLISAEPYDSPLVKATRPPRLTGNTNQTAIQASVEGLPMKGQLGLSIRYDDAGRMKIDQLDTSRVGYVCGLRDGDEIYRVDGRRVRNQVQLVTRIIDGLAKGSVIVQVRRGGRVESVILRQLILPSMLESHETEADSLQNNKFQPGKSDFRLPQ